MIRSAAMADKALISLRAAPFDPPDADHPGALAIARDPDERIIDMALQR